MKEIRRFDISELAPPKKRADGTLRVDARLTRSGVFAYLDALGNIRREWRPPDEVFKSDSLDSLQLVPLTMDHPSGGVDARNARRHQIGAVGQDVRRDGMHVRSTLAVNDASSIETMESGKNELSCGYVCRLEMSSGVTPDGEKYDAIQRDIVYDHVAVVDRGRAGPTVFARMDSEDVAVMQCDTVAADDKPPSEGRGKQMEFTVKLDGVDFSFTAEKSAEQALKKTLDSFEGAKAEADAKVQEAQKEAQEAQAKADAAAAELEKEREARKADTADVPALVRARVKLEKDASAVLDEVKADASDDEIKRAAAAKAYPDLDLEGKADAYIECLFDRAVDAAKADAAKDIEAKKDRQDLAKQDSAPVKKQDAREKFIEEQRTAWLKPIGAHYDPEKGLVKGA